MPSLYTAADFYYIFACCAAVNLKNVVWCPRETVERFNMGIFPEFSMDELDRRILQELQEDFPLCQDPYGTVARRLKIACDELWDRIQRLLADGVIRRIGAGVDYGKLGFCGTLAAVSVKPELIDKAAAVIGAYDEVTHCYLRKDAFNIWFTVIAPDREGIERILEQIRSVLSLEPSQLLNLPATRVFKLHARFRPLP
jgi:DNA-binding Lrp family transcriptional regulator